MALSYSSGSGNGIIGVGWSLNASSAIHRCAATYAQDGFTHNVTYSATKDRLCINGQRLMAISGTYGQASTIYKTELDSFTRVKQFGGINDSTTSFEVNYPDGTTAYFGADTQSRNIHSGVSTVMQWNISYQHDASENNYIHYQYNNFAAGEQLLTDIYYTGNSAASSGKGDRRVNFVYQTRTDTTSGYVAGGKVEQTQVLSQINTFVGNRKVRQYQLTTDNSVATGRSILKSIQPCGYISNQIDCGVATTFNWSERAETIKLQPLGVNGTHAYPNIGDIDQVLPHGDRNGDGGRDWSGYYVNAEGELNTSNDLDLHPCERNIYTRRLECFEADFNQDGLTDDWEKNNGKLYLNITNGSEIDTGIALPNSQFHGLSPSRIVNISDYNGDGWPDLMIYREYSSSQAPKLLLYLHSQNVNNPYTYGEVVFSYVVYSKSTEYVLATDIQFMGDITGDGLPDLIQVATGAGNSVPYAQPRPKVLYKSNGCLLYTSPSPRD